jgi:hypothetical protein
LRWSLSHPGYLGDDYEDVELRLAYWKGWIDGGRKITRVP